MGESFYKLNKRATLKNRNWQRVIITTKGFFKEYSLWFQKIPKKRKHIYKIDWIIMQKILTEMYGEIFKLIIENGFMWRMPKRFGHLYVGGKLRLPRFTDNEIPSVHKGDISWGNTIKAKKEYPELAKEYFSLPHDNTKTNHYIYRLRWDKSFIKNIEIFRFKPYKAIKRKLAQTLASGDFTKYTTL